MKHPNTHRVSIMAAVASALALTCAANAESIGFVRNPNNALSGDPFDAAWIPRLESQGHTVTVLSQANLWNASSIYDLYIISQDVAGSTAWGNYGAATKPLLIYEPATWYNNIFGASAGGNTCTNLTISLPVHPLAAGLSGDVVVYTGSGNMPTFNPANVSSGTQVIGVNANNPAQGAFVLLEAGAIGGDGNTWSAKRIGLPCYDNWNPTLVTTDGWKLLDGAVAYALVPEPSSFALIGFGLVAFLARRQRR